jgi:FrmR/RcnR family transcriptional regulator, repressor of frmRAB operon
MVCAVPTKAPMAHTTRHKQMLLNRVRRIRGQVQAIEKALDEEQDCGEILQTVAACRGAINGLMCEILEGHVREHVLDPRGTSSSKQIEAAEELIRVVKAYLK